MPGGSSRRALYSAACVAVSIGWLGCIPSASARSLSGTAHADRLIGGSGSDLLRGGAGNDVLDGRGGADRVDGEPERM